MATAMLTCPDCGEPMMLKRNASGLFYGCPRYPDCQGYCGAHPTGAPMGVPGNLETKQARHRAHQAFDALWRERRLMSRGAAYKWLSMKFETTEAHIGAMDAEQCERVIKLCEAFDPTDISSLDELRQAKAEYQQDINDRRLSVRRRKHKKRLMRSTRHAEVDDA